MERSCDICGGAYDAKRPNSKYCGDTCRKRAQRGAVAVGDVEQVPTLVPDLEVGPVETALLAELTGMERSTTALGLAALALARRVDIGRDTGAGLAALVKQLEATVKAATADVKSDQSVLDKRRDDLAARRAARGA